MFSIFAIIVFQCSTQTRLIWYPESNLYWANCINWLKKLFFCEVISARLQAWLWPVWRTKCCCFKRGLKFKNWKNNQTLNYLGCEVEIKICCEFLVRRFEVWICELNFNGLLRFVWKIKNYFLLFSSLHCSFDCFLFFIFLFFIFFNVDLP